MEDTYLTIQGEAQGLYKEKGSKFLAFAYRVKEEQEIKDIVQGLRKQYYDARHWCYAYMLGPDKKLYRANDDGEPSGSAGLPILGQIRSKELTNILVVVVRYFGGTKLGVPGLIHAYKVATADALEAATIVEEYVQRVLKISFDYPQMNEVMKVAKTYELDFGQQSFDMRCHITFSVRASLFEMVSQLLSDVDGCELQILA